MMKVQTTILRSLLITALLLAAITSGHTQTAPRTNALNQVVRTAEYLEPAIPRVEQEAEVKRKLDALEKKTGRKPNVLILLVDDLGYGDTGAYGGGEGVGSPTPNIDRLAREGLRLTSTYAQPTCTPTRAALMTGRLPVRSGLIRPMIFGETITVNPWADEVSAARMLSAAGYKTGLSGKWHLGEPDGMQPQQVGYDEWLGFLLVQSQYSTLADARRYPSLHNVPGRLQAAQMLNRFGNIYTARKGEALRAVKPLDMDALANCDQDFADYSADFIKRAATEKKPFYLVHAFSKVHYDNYPAKGYAGRSPAGTPYRDAVVEVDDIVGRLVETLRQTGQLENTLVFFTSDNGPAEDNQPDAGFTPFRGAKGTTWEGGVRVPGIAFWPGMIKPGRTSDGLFDLMDLFNTSLAVAGIHDKIAPERYIDGIDQSSFLLADNGKSRRQTVYMYADSRFASARYQEFKIQMLPQMTENPFGAIGNTMTGSTGLTPWVYNLYSDPKEQEAVGVRNYEWLFPWMLMELRRHQATFVKYPPKRIGLELVR
jgi:arylsulfatase